MKLSLTKIFIFIAGVILLINLKDIFKIIKTIHVWLAKSLDGLNQFSEGAQTAIAFTSILLVVVMIYKLIERRF